MLQGYVGVFLDKVKIESHFCASKGEWDYYSFLTLDIKNPPVIPGEDRCVFGTPEKPFKKEMFRGSNTDPHKVWLDV